MTPELRRAIERDAATQPAAYKAIQISSLLVADGRSATANSRRMLQLAREALAGSYETLRNTHGMTQR